MNARQRCRERRQIRYRDQCRIRQIRLNLIRTANAHPRSIEEIIDDVWRDYPTQHNELINFILTFKSKLADPPSSSLDNRCLTKTYLYTVKNRYRRRRKGKQFVGYVK